MRKATPVAYDATGDVQKKVVKVDTKRMANELSKAQDVVLSSIVVETGSRSYGPPPDASQRRM